MELKDIARRLPDDLWEIFEPLLPPVVWCGNGRPPKSNTVCAWSPLRLGLRDLLGEAPALLAFLQDHPAPPHTLVAS